MQVSLNKQFAFRSGGICQSRPVGVSQAESNLVTALKLESRSSKGGGESAAE